MRKNIYEEVSVKTNEIFEKFQADLGINSGDIEPCMWIRLEEAQKNLAEVINEALLFQCLSNGIEARKLISNLLTKEEKEMIYREVGAEKVKNDAMFHAKESGIALSESEAEIVADRYVNDGDYETGLSYWDNLDNLIMETKPIKAEQETVIKIEVKPIPKQFTDAANTEELLKCARKMLETGTAKDSVKLSLNLLDPDTYVFEYSESDGLMCITRHGTSLTGVSDIIGATGLFSSETLKFLTEGIEDILGINRVSLTGILNGREVHFTVSKGWHMMQDKDEDILMKALADVNASLIDSDDDFVSKKISGLREMQRIIRECKTLYPKFSATVTYAPGYDQYLLISAGSQEPLEEDTASQVEMLVKGYKISKEEGVK